ncbi:MAG TPA: hypothetical protein VMV92_43720 [Streptosporangiaceae bacterium]|nr:hypothetical protein [Streptosporangiaceae bacterium]
MPTGKELWQAVLEQSDDLCDTYDVDLLPAAAMRRAGRASGSRLGGLVALLAGFGAVTGDADRPVITPLGRWAVHRLEDAPPGAADPEISAAELIAEVAEYDDAAQRLEAASGWLEQHHPREILEAAESMSPLLRAVAADLVEMLGEHAIPAWREFTAAPHVGPHARYAVYARGRNRTRRTFSGSAPSRPLPRWTARVPTRRCAWSGSPCAEKTWPVVSPWSARRAILRPGNWHAR